MAIAKALVRHVSGHTLLAKTASSHWVPIDSPLEGNPAAANDPVQLLLIACGGCVMLDTVDILAKKKQEFTLLEFEIVAVRRDTPPKIIRRLDYRVHINGEAIREDAVRRAVELSLTKYCSVSLSLDRSVRLFVHLTINGITGKSWEIFRATELYTE